MATPMRIIIGGGPKSGKTTLAERSRGSLAPDGLRILHTDDVAWMGWSEASLEVSFWYDRPAPWIVEGVATIRALRKWLQLNPVGAPCDKLVMLRWHSADQRHQSMSDGVWKVFHEVQPELLRRGVEIEIR